MLEGTSGGSDATANLSFVAENVMCFTCFTGMFLMHVSLTASRKCGSPCQSIKTPTKGQFGSRLSCCDVYMTQHMVSHMVGRLINVTVLDFYGMTLLYTVPEALRLYSHMRPALILYLGVSGNNSAANNACINSYTINLL